MRKPLGSLILVTALALVPASHATQLRNDAFTLSPARASFGLQVDVPAAEVHHGLRIEVFSNAAGQTLTVSATNARGRMRSASGNGRVTLTLSGDDFEKPRPG